MKKICLVEDEKDLISILALYLSKNNWEVIECTNMQEAKRYIYSDIDLWILDIMLPDGNGFEILKEIKQMNPQIPVILISARGESIDRVVGFEIGCDDYISKPFLPAELVFRVTKLFDKSLTAESSIIYCEPYVIDKTRRIVFEKEQKINLTSREFDIIIFFIEQNTLAISREKLLEQIWGEDYYGSDRVVDNYIKKIRKKLPQLSIETIYGYGYRCNL